MFLSLLSCLLLLQPQVHESGNLNHNLVLPGGVYLPPTSCRSVSSPAAESGWPVFVESKSTSQAHSVHYKANLGRNACWPGPVSTPTAQHWAIDGSRRGPTAERPGVRSATVASGNARQQVWCCQTLQAPGISPNQTPSTDRAGEKGGYSRALKLRLISQVKKEGPHFRNGKATYKSEFSGAFNGITCLFQLTATS